MSAATCSYQEVHLVFFGMQVKETKNQQSDQPPIGRGGDLFEMHTYMLYVHTSFREIVRLSTRPSFDNLTRSRGVS